MKITKTQIALIINKHSDFDEEGTWIPDFESASAEINDLLKPKWATFSEYWDEHGDPDRCYKLAEDAWDGARK